MTKALIRNVYLTARMILLRLFIRQKPVQRIDPAGVDSILVIRIDRIGDMVVSVPAIKALKQLFPSSRMTALLGCSTVDLARLVPEIDEVIVYRGFLPALISLRKRRFAVVVDLLMDYTLKTASLAFLSGGRITCGFDIAARGRFFNAAFKPLSGLKQMSRYLLDLVCFLSALSGKECVRADIDPVLTLTDSARISSREFLQRNGIKDDDAVFGIAPGAKFPSQCWKEERFALLADRIADRYRAKIIIIASGSDEVRVGKIRGFMKTEPVVALGLPLETLSGLISRFRVLVANNSGPLHIAAALGVATVSTMGPTVPDLWRPHGNKHIVIRRDPACSPCNRAFCRSHECMEDIQVEDMEKAVETLMDGI